MNLCMDSSKFLWEAPGTFILFIYLFILFIYFFFWGGVATILWQLTDPFEGASITQGASNRDITVYIYILMIQTELINNWI